ncbi:unnamed protein product [Durusdinium trenchii]|uniref:Uncharacterized protein n=1 Tax=Durusdinium trenchii TaxID=1381693 RepID=A0ABP0N4L5_9DINO
MGIADIQVTRKPEAPSDDPLPDALEVDCPSDRKRSKRQQKVQRAREQLQQFLQIHGFSHVNEPRRTFGFSLRREELYPIHVAAKLGDDQMIRLLLSAGASLEQQTSNGRIALDFAADADRFGSHRDVLGLLRSEVKVLTVRNFIWSREGM